MQAKRFYDNERAVSDALSIIQLFPAYLQNIIARGLCLIAIRDFKADDRMSNLISLGRDRVLALYQSKLKRREIDTNTDLHASVNYLRILEPPEREQVARKLIDMAAYADAYMTHCLQMNAQAHPEQVTVIRDRYAMFGPSEAKRYVQRIRDEMLRQRQNESIRLAELDHVASFDGTTIRKERSSDL